MKVLVVIAALLFVGWHIDARAIVDTSAELDEDDEACIAELNLNRDKILTVDTDQPLPENNADFTKLMECSSKRQGIITPTGQINYNKIKEELVNAATKDPDLTPRMLTVFKQIATVALLNCQENRPTGTDLGLIAIKTLNCVTKELEEVAKSL